VAAGAAIFYLLEAFFCCMAAVYAFYKARKVIKQYKSIAAELEKRSK
jgi:cell division protein FtsL